MLPSRHTSECQDLLKRCWLAPPMLCDYLPTRLPSQVTKEERGNDGIVERTNDRDELRNQVDGRSKPRQSEDEKELGSPGDALVSQKSAEKQEEVGDQYRERTGCGLPAGEGNDQNEQQPESHSRSRRDDEDAHPVILLILAGHRERHAEARDGARLNPPPPRLIAPT